MNLEMQKEDVINCKEKYSKVRKLLDEDSKNDPVTEPYLSKYKAKSILLEIQEILETNRTKMQDTSDVKIDAMLGAVLLHIGVIEMETDELTNSEKTLSNAENLLSKNSLHNQVIITLLNIYNNLGVLWSNRNVPNKAKSFLLKSKELYETFKCTMEMPVSINNLFEDVDQQQITDFMDLEKAYTLTLYYLAQVYGTSKLDLKSAIYCHVTLKRQLSYDDYEPIDWALNSATLSQFFAGQNGFFQARHHLAAASVILETYEKELKQSESDDEQYKAKLETFNHRSADVALCWVKYCLNLMTSSKNRLFDNSDGVASVITDLSNITFTDEENICNGDITKLVFENLDVSEMENKVTDKYLLIYDDARKVFLFCQSWISKATEYYSLENLASDYIKIVQDHSQLYHYLAFFEEDEDRRSKMCKRRINMLEDVLKEINPTYYMQYCREIWLELGETYSRILTMKYKRVENANPTPHALTKINSLCDKSIEKYNEFINSIKDPKTGKMPSKLDLDILQPLINAYVSVGRLYMQKIEVDKQAKLVKHSKSYEAYKIAVDIYEQNESVLQFMNEEIGLCRHMLQLLPHKMNMVITKLDNF